MSLMKLLVSSQERLRCELETYARRLVECWMDINAECCSHALHQLRDYAARSGGSSRLLSFAYLIQLERYSTCFQWHRAAYIISLEKSLVLVTQSGLYVPGERLLVEDNTFNVRTDQENPGMLPSEINNDMRVGQYAALLQHLRQTALNTPPINDVSTKQHNALAYAAFQDGILESHALIGCRCIRSEMNSKVVPVSVQKAILAGKLDVARVLLFGKDPLTSNVQRRLYHSILSSKHVYQVDVTEPSIQQAVQAEDREVVNLICREKYPVASAARRNNWDIVHRLVSYGFDPNQGPSFMARPLSVSIMCGKLEEAEYLLRNHATRDLGDQFYPLRDAIIRRNVADAQAVLKRPRFLRVSSVETKRQTLQRNFLEVYRAFQNGSQTRGVSQEFKNFGASFDNHRFMWRKGMTAIRRLMKNRSPKSFQQVIGLLCVASAMRESLSSHETFGSYDLFVEDLDRWKQFTVLPHQQQLFDEIALSVWGKRENLTRTPDLLEQQQEDRSRLFESVQKLVERFTEDSTSPLHLLDNVDEFWDHDGTSDSTSIRLFQPKRSHKDDLVSGNTIQDTSSPDLTAHGPVPSMKDPREYSDWEPGIIAFVMMGAIFACIISFIFALHTGTFFFTTSPGDIPTLLNNSYWTVVYQSLAKLPFFGFESAYLEAGEHFITGRFRSLEDIRTFICGQAQLQLNAHLLDVLDTSLRCAATPILSTLEGWALQDRYALTESFLKTWAKTDSTDPTDPEKYISDQSSQTQHPSTPSYKPVWEREDDVFLGNHNDLTAWQTPRLSSNIGGEASSTNFDIDSGSTSSPSTSTPSIYSPSSAPMGESSRCSSWPTRDKQSTSNPSAATSPERFPFEASSITPTPSKLNSDKEGSSPVGSRIVRKRTRHKCQICGTAFANTGNLNRHLAKHQDSQRHPCRNSYLGCKYSDIRRDNVHKHELKHCQYKRAVLPIP